ncbi:MAG: hypothetical protein IPK04_15440 [Bdellovibrionales bacterium]|nr:hypothetical protein [Bdellovibrionales bacterium]
MDLGETLSSPSLIPLSIPTLPVALSKLFESQCTQIVGQGPFLELWLKVQTFMRCGPLPATSGSTSYRLVKTTETGFPSTYCSWVGDGYTYRGLGYDAGKLFIRKNYNSLIFQKFDPSTCLAEGILSFSSQTDDAGFSLVAWGDMFQAIGGKLLVPFQTSSANKLKLFDPTLLKYSDYALEQSLAGEQLRLNTSFVVQK